MLWSEARNECYDTSAGIPVLYVVVTRDTEETGQLR